MFATQVDEKGDPVSDSILHPRSNAVSLLRIRHCPFPVTELGIALSKIAKQGIPKPGRTRKRDRC